MKFVKTLSAAAVSAALLGATAASAADVTLYGIVDQGLLYKHTRTNGSSSNSLSMVSGLFAPSRWGMKGTEELGNGLKVGFKLESGFNSDNGQTSSDRLFHRESALTVSGGFGTLAAGRMGGVGSSAGTFDLVYAMSEVSDGGWDNSYYGLYMTSRFDNVLAYQTPKFAGLQATFQYSFKMDDTNKDDGAEGTSKANRYYSGALTYENGALQAVLAYEYINRGNDNEQDGKNIRRNQQTVSLGGSYDFGVAKLFGLAQYSDGADGFAHFGTGDMNDLLGKGKVRYDGFKGWAAHLGAAVPVCGGTVTSGVYYKDAEAQKTTLDNVSVENLDGKFFGINVQYAYPLSKRTHVYCGAGYGQSKLESKNSKLKTEESIGYVGMAHFF